MLGTPPGSSGILLNEASKLASPTTLHCNLRVENIPVGTTAEQVKGQFIESYRPRLQIQTLVPSARPEANSDWRLTATASFSRRDNLQELPVTLNKAYLVDDRFVGFTPLNDPKEDVCAE